MATPGVGPLPSRNCWTARCCSVMTARTRSTASPTRRRAEVINPQGTTDMKATRISVAVLVALAAAGCAKKEAAPVAEAAAPTAPAAAAPPAEILIPGEHITPESLTSTADGHVIIG